MATMVHTESRSLYSWWWDSHISPKNSKWLQENLTDMDTKVKAMIKLIEEDADSFARRAEMYYKKRPELMKLVEEFYRAYRALAERYDHATGALRQAQKTMAEAFPNQIPLALLDESTSGSVSEVEPHTPEMPSSILALFEPADLDKDALGMSSHYHAIKRNVAFSEENDVMSRKGLKQLKEMFATGEGAARAKLAEGKVRKGLNFEVEQGKSFEHKTLNGAKEHNQNSGEKEVADRELKCLQEEVSRLSREIQNLKSQIISESERADKAQTEIGTLEETVSQLKSEKEAALFQCQLSMERISNLENEISCTQDDFKNLNSKMAKDVAKLHGAEERCLLLEKANQSLQINFESLERKTKLQKYELNQKKEELEKVKLSLQSIEKLHSQSQEEVKHLSLMIQSGVDKLKGMEVINMSLLEEVHQLKEQNGNLHEQTLSCAQKMENQQDEIFQLKERRRKLEEEVGLHVEEKKALQHELCHLKEDRDDLEQKHKDLVEQMEAVNSNVKSLQTLIKELRDGNAELKGICEKHKEEKVIHLKSLEHMEEISEKNAVLENSLSDATLELEGLRQKTNSIEKCRESLRDQLAVHVSEKARLVSQLEVTAQDMEKISERNTFLENSLSDLNAELEALNMNLEHLEESYQSLNDEKSSLLSEKSNLVCQVQCSAQNMEKLSEENAFLERSLHERDVALEVHKVKLKDLEESCQFLYDEKTSLLAEKNALVSQVEAFAHNIEKYSEKNAFLENSLSNCSTELQARGAKLKNLEESFQSLHEEKENLISEKNNLLSQFEAAAQTMERLSENNAFLEKSLLDGKVELEDIRVRLQGSEESCQLLCDEKSNLLVEKNSLVSQIETTVQYVEQLSEKRFTLEKSPSDANIELEALSSKLKQLQEFCQLLCVEKFNLLAERNTLVSQVENISQSLEKMNKHEELEEKHLNLACVEVVNLNQLMELQECLKVENREHEILIQSSEYWLATLENQIRLLQEELQLREEELEVDLQRNINSQTENLILHRCVLDMREMNFVLSGELLKQLKISRDADEIISDLRKESITQKIAVASLIEQNEKLRDGISVMLRAFNINKDYGSSDGIRDEVLLQIIFNKIRSLLDSISNDWDENQQLIIEKSVVFSVLEQLAVDMADLRAEKSVLEQEYEIRTKELSMLHGKQDELLEINGLLGQTLQACVQREKALKGEIEVLSRQLSNLQEVCCLSRKEICELVRENQSLSKRLHDLGEENNSKEAENNVILEEAMTLQILHLVFRSLSDQRASELMLVRKDLNCLLGLKNDLSQGIRTLNQKMEELQEENMHLKGLVVSLEECMYRLMNLEDDLSRAQDQCEQLNLQIQNANYLLKHKDLELSDAKRKMQEAHQASQGQIQKLIEGKESLSEELYNLKEKKNQLEVENSSILSEVMTLECLHLFYKNLSAERAVEKSCNNKIDCILGLNNDLYEEIRVYNKKMGLLVAESTNIKKSTISLEEAHEKSQGEISKFVEENQTLSMEIYKLKEQKDAVEKETNVILVEALTVESLYMFFRSLSKERGLELQLLSNDLNHIYELKNALEEDIRLINGRMEMLELENIHLKESVIYLENEVKAARDICEQLNLETENRKTLLIKKDLELSEANRMVQSAQEKNLEICRELEVLKLDIDEAKVLQGELERTILASSECNAYKEEEITCLHKAKEMLEKEICTLHKEVEVLRSREELFTSKLKEGMHELVHCEEEIAVLLQDIQITTVNATFFEEKVLQRMVDCEGLLICAMIKQAKLYEEISASNAYADDLKRKLDDLDGENRGLKDNLNALFSLIMSLQDSMSSLEEHTISLAKLQTSKNLEEEDNSLASSAYYGSHGELKEDYSTSMEPSGVSQMKKLLAKIEALQNVVTISRNLLEKERFHAVTNLNAARAKDEHVAGPKLQKNDAEVSKSHGQVMKDIQLDQVSSCSQYGCGGNLYWPSKIEISDTDDQMLELWETAESDCNKQMMKTSSVANEHDIEYHEIEAGEEKSEYPSKLMTEKELSIDKLALPKITIESYEEWKMNIIEQLASDAQRLSVLQTGVQELMHKIKSSEKTKTPLSIEYNAVETQLKDAEGAILQLIDININLTRKAEDYSAPPGILVEEKEEMGKTGRKQLSEHAWRGSEKIGNLELELQKIHYILLKLEEENQSRTKTMERRSSTLLRDYLSGKRENRRRKGLFCGCMRPKTKG